MFTTNLNNPTENWIPVPNYEKLYLVSDLGNVKALALTKRRGRYFQFCPEKYLKQKRERRGYRHVTLCLNSSRRTIGVHQLVALAFIPNPLCKPTVNHKDGDKANNKKSNLEWATQQDQITHAIETGLMSDFKGMDSPVSKLTDSQVLAIRDKTLGLSIIQLAQKFKVYRSTISKIRARQTWRHI